MKLRVLLAFLLAFMFVRCSQVTSDPVTKSIPFSYTATGDDGTVGQASYAIIRMAQSGSELIDNWESCRAVFEHTPGPPGVKDTLSVSIDVETGIEYYFAMKIADEIQPYGSTDHWQIDTTVSPWDTTALTVDGRNWSILSNIITRTFPDTDAPLAITDFDFGN